MEERGGQKNRSEVSAYKAGRLGKSRVLDLADVMTNAQKTCAMEIPHCVEILKDIERQRSSNA